MCTMVFGSSVVIADWRFVVIIPLYKNKGERTECKNYSYISLSSVEGKIYAGILADNVRRVTED